MNKVNSEVYVDISIIIKMMPEEMRNKLSKKFIEFIENNKSTNYNSNINPEIPLKEQELRQETKEELRQETKEMIGIIYRDYLCSKEEKARLIREEEIELEHIEEGKRKQYDPNNIFKRNNRNLEEKEKPDLKGCNVIKYREPFIKRMLNKLKSIFRIK